MQKRIDEQERIPFGVSLMKRIAVSRISQAASKTSTSKVVSTRTNSSALTYLAEPEVDYDPDTDTDVESDSD